MTRKIRTFPALIAIFLITAAGYGAGRIWISRQNMQAKETPEDREAAVMNDLVTRLANGDYEGLYDSFASEETVIDSRQSYENALQSRLNGIDPGSLVWIRSEDSAEEKPQFVLSDGEKSLLMVDLARTEDGYAPVIPLHGEKSVRIEVPKGMTIYAGGTLLTSDHIVEADVPASNFSQVYDDSFIPVVDIYEIDHLLDVPSLQDETGQELSMVQDVISGDLLVGNAVEDDDLKQTIIDAAEKLAAYPAQDGSLGAVSAIADPSSSWYGKYCTLANTWFTGHSIHEFSNQDVPSIAAQSEDTVTAHVVFDYFADSGQYSRTWHIGYQLTMHSINGTWYVCGTAIDNELNPNSVPAE